MGGCVPAFPRVGTHLCQFGLAGPRVPRFRSDLRMSVSAHAAAPKKDEQEQQEDSVPPEYKSALRQADNYANVMHMSKAGLLKQLTSEYGDKFSQEAAQYAVDNVKADWNANVLAKAKSYQENMAMSPEAIRDQLTSEYGEQFTPEEADYAIQHLNN